MKTLRLTAVQGSSNGALVQYDNPLVGEVCPVTQFLFLPCTSVPTSLELRDCSAEEAALLASMPRSVHFSSSLLPEEAGKDLSLCCLTRVAPERKGALRDTHGWGGQKTVVRGMGDLSMWLTHPHITPRPDHSRVSSSWRTLGP